MPEWLEVTDMIDSFLKYLKYEKRFSRHSVISYRNDLSQLNAFISEKYPETRIEEVNHAIIRDWLINLSEKDLASRTINRKIITLRSFYKFLNRRGLIDKNPALKIHALKTPQNLPQFVREGDMNLLMDHTDFGKDFIGIRNQLILEIFYGTGIRLSELIQLKASDFDRFNSQIKVLGKRNKERLIPITSHLAHLIDNYIELKNNTFRQNNNPHLIVTNKGGKLYPMFVYRIVKKYLGITNVDKKSPHVLRHTYATHLLGRGADLNAVKDLLGHQSLAATQVYTHNTLGKLKKIFDQAHPKA